MSVRWLAVTLLLAGAPAAAAGQDLADYDYENLSFRGVGLDYGYIWPTRVQSTAQYSARIDLGYLGPGLRIMPTLSYWSSEFRRSELEQLATQLEQLPVLQEQGVDISADDLGTVEWSDLAFGVDAQMVWTTPLQVLTFVGANLSLHALNGRGDAIGGTFVEDLLDSTTAGVAVMAGAEYPVSPQLRVYGEMRYTLASDVRYPGVRVGAALMLPPRGGGKHEGAMSEQPKVRVGVLGLGAIAQVVHLPVLSQLEGAELVAVCDADRSKAQAIAARFGIPRVYARDEDVFRADEVDAIVICTPSYLHDEQAVAALESGKHTLVEKPIALTAEGAERAIAAAERAGRTLMVAMNNRYRPDTMALRPFVQGGELGEIFLARGAWLNRKMRIARPTWRHRRATAGGGALMDLGVQTLDLTLWLLGYPQVSSVISHLHYPVGLEVEDSAAMLLRLANGSGISLTVSWSLVAERDRHYLRLLGTRGSGAISPLAVYKEIETGMIDVTPTMPMHRENLYTVSYRQELTQFLSVIRGEQTHPLPTEQIDVMKVVATAYRSAEEKREVAVE